MPNLVQYITLGNILEVSGISLIYPFSPVNANFEQIVNPPDAVETQGYRDNPYPVFPWAGQQLFVPDDVE